VSTAVDVATVGLAFVVAYFGAVGLDRLLRLIRPPDEPDQPTPLADVPAYGPTGVGWPSNAMVEAAAGRRLSRRFVQEQAWATYRPVVQP
jgi:hypothetical protein